MGDSARLTECGSVRGIDLRGTPLELAVPVVRIGDSRGRYPRVACSCCFPSVLSSLRFSYSYKATFHITTGVTLMTWSVAVSSLRNMERG